MGGIERKASFSKGQQWRRERGKNVLGRAKWLKVGGGVFIPLPEKEPLQPLRPETPDHGGRRLRPVRRLRTKSAETPDRGEQGKTVCRKLTPETPDHKRPETPVWAETPGRLRTNSGFKTAAAAAKLFNAEKPDGPETPDLEGGNSGPAGNSGETPDLLRPRYRKRRARGT